MYKVGGVKRVVSAVVVLQDFIFIISVAMETIKISNQPPQFKGNGC